MLNRVSVAGGTSEYQIQIGSGSFTTTGYLATSSYISGGVASANSNYTGGFILMNLINAAYFYSGIITICLIDSNKWVASGTLSLDGAANAIFISAGVAPTLGGALDRVRLTTGTGTDTLDAGSVNILYE
jgi:hypothetical protein